MDANGKRDCLSKLPSCYRCGEQPCVCRDGITLYHADCRDILPLLEPGSVDLVCTDPPYGLEFMGKEWDKPWATGMVEYGMVDSHNRKPGPVHGSNRNAVCTTCHKHRRGTDRCRCKSPKWDETPATNNRKMQSWFTEMFTAILAACKPGTMLASFGGTRTYHRLTCGIEDAGWEVRDCMMHLYGQGFPKSLDISKAIDKAAAMFRVDNTHFQEIRKWLRSQVKAKGLTYKQIDTALGNPNSHKASHYLDNSQPQLPTAEDWDILKRLLGINDDIERPPKFVRLELFEREIIGHRKVQKGVAFTSEGPDKLPVTVPATPAAKEWEGYGTAAKPAWEPIVLAMKPLDGTFAENALKHGVAGINVDGGRIGTQDKLSGSGGPCLQFGGQNVRPYQETFEAPGCRQHPAGRWPANLILQHCSLPVYRLAGRMSVDIEQQIRRYFDGYDKVRALRQSRQGTEQKPPVLFAGVLRGDDQGQAEKQVPEADLPELRQDVRVHPVLGEGGETEILQPKVFAQSAKQDQGQGAPDVWTEAHDNVSQQNVQVDNGSRAGGQEAPVLEGREVENQGRIHRGDSDSTDAPAVGNSRADVARQGHCDGASTGDGNAPGEAAKATGVSASRQRKQKRQPAGESGAVSKRNAFTKAQRSGAGIEQGTQREPQAKDGSPPLEVLACDIPQGWFGYFVETDEDLGCMQVGVKKVKGGNDPRCADGSKSGHNFHGFDEKHKHDDRLCGHEGYADADGLEEVESWNCHPDCPVGMLDEQSGELTSGALRAEVQAAAFGQHGIYNEGKGGDGRAYAANSGTASRFFYCAKASGKDRGNLSAEEVGPLFPDESIPEFRNDHPTVKPLELMRYLLILLYPPSPDAVCLDPFAGSGTTGVAAKSMGRKCILVELEESYCKIAARRLEQEVLFK